MELIIGQEYAFVGYSSYTGIYKGLSQFGSPSFEMTCEHPFTADADTGFVAFAETPISFVERYNIQPVANLDGIQ